MTLSIRARLTLWYSTIVVVVLVTAAIVGSIAQSRLSRQRLDDELARTMATLEGVMRTEFREGLTLDAAADEASTEVVVPDRIMLLMRADGGILALWGVPFDRSLVPAIAVAPDLATVTTTAGELRVLKRWVTFENHRYHAAVMAPMVGIRQQQGEMVRAMLAGIVIALLAAALGGWLIARQTLKPLTRMADQAGRINERHPTERLVAPSVDELGQLAASFNGVLDRLASALDHQRQFMADASHELRTPVSVIRTATQVTLAKDARSVDEYRESLTIVGEQANRLSGLVDAMFLLSRAEAKGVPLHREFLNLDDVLAESARALRVLANERGVTVTTNGEQEVGLTGDDALLRRMVGNLLDNAIRHAGPSGQVHASLERADHRIELRVTNDGTAIAAEDRDRIFERFVRVGESEGAGLGLPIARWIAEAHGGSVRLERSTPGDTTFVVELPADTVIEGSSSD